MTGGARRSAPQRYARWLSWGSRLGLALLALGLALYLAGVAPQVPIDQLPALWDQPAAEYLQRAGLQRGWHWATLLHRSDMLVIAAIALLASCSIACLAAVVPIFLRDRERALAWICVAQIVVLVAAASGWFGAAH